MTKDPILIVDDTEFDRNLLSKALQIRGGFNTVTVRNGQAALEVLETTKVSLVITDYLMPQMKGIDLLVEIRKSFNAVELPVIVVTSTSDDRQVIDCLNAGANDYVSKPIIPDILVSRVSTQFMMSELSNEMAALKGIQTLDAAVTSFCHEINNPLSIAIGLMNKKDLNEPALREKLNATLWRIADILKAIEDVGEKRDISYASYASGTQMLKIR